METEELARQIASVLNPPKCLTICDYIDGYICCAYCPERYDCAKTTLEDRGIVATKISSSLKKTEICDFLSVWDILYDLENKRLKIREGCNNFRGE